MKIVFSDMNSIPAGGIFLAGPTRRNSKYKNSWRKSAIDIFESKGYDGIIYIPEYKNNQPFEETISNIHRQTDWEWEALGKASVILFWIPRELPDMPAFTTNVEFGRYTALTPHKVVLGYPKEAVKMRYLDYLYNKACNRTSKTSLEDTINEALTLYNQLSLS